jgi:hypothetical protein
MLSLSQVTFFHVYLMSILPHKVIIRIVIFFHLHIPPQVISRYLNTHRLCRRVVGALAALVRALVAVAVRVHGVLSLAGRAAHAEAGLVRAHGAVHGARPAQVLRAGKSKCRNTLRAGKSKCRNTLREGKSKCRNTLREGEKQMQKHTEGRGKANAETH